MLKEQGHTQKNDKGGSPAEGGLPGRWRHDASMSDDKDLVVKRWDAERQAVPPLEQDRGIERIVNDWLERHPDRTVKSLTVKYSYEAYEGDRENIRPHYVVFIASDK